MFLCLFDSDISLYQINLILFLCDPPLRDLWQARSLIGSCESTLNPKYLAIQINVQIFRGFIKGLAPGKLTGCEQDSAINLPGWFRRLFLLSFIRKTKNARLKNPTDLLHKNLMKPLEFGKHETAKTIRVQGGFN